MRGHEPGSEHEPERETDGPASDAPAADTASPPMPPPSFGRSPVAELPDALNIPGFSGAPGAPGIPTWQPPPAFTAAAAGMQVWSGPTGDPPPTWPAATGEPIGEPWPGQPAPFAAQVGPSEESVPPYFGAPTSPGDVPVWPPHARQAYDTAMGIRPVPERPDQDGPATETPPPVPGPFSPEPSRPGADTASAETTLPAGMILPGSPAETIPSAASAPAPDTGGPEGSRIYVEPRPTASESPPLPGPPTTPSDSSIRPSVADPVGLPPVPASFGTPSPTGAADSPTPAAPRTGPTTVAGPFSGFGQDPPRSGAQPSRGAFLPPGQLPPRAFGSLPPASAAKSGTGKKVLVGMAIAVAIGAIGTGGYLAYQGLGEQPEALGQVPSVVKPPEADPTPGTRDLLAAERTDPEQMTLTEAFPRAKVTVARRTYKRVKTNLLNDCERAASGKFAEALKKEGCTRLLRATYVDGKHKYAVTTGIAVMPTKDAATRADAAKDLGDNVWFRGLRGASGTGAERMDISGGYASGLVWGRYIVFSYATYSDGHTPTAKETDLGPISGGFRDTIAKVIEKRAMRAATN